MGSISSTWATRPFTLCTSSAPIGRTASTWPPDRRPPLAACCSNAPWPETCTSWRSISHSPALAAWPRARRAVGNGRRAGKGMPGKSMKLAALLLIAPLAASAADALAPTPPMGWNSWDSYGTTVTEAEVKANADYMAARLKSHGWQYVVVDIQWSEPHPQTHGYRPNADLVMDENGRLTPATNRFPSGFKALAESLHGKGLKFGIHIMRGIPRRAVAANLPVSGGNARPADIADPKSICRWNGDMYGIDMSKPGAQDYYDSILQLYAGWGVDYIKCDDIAIPFHGD